MSFWVENETPMPLPEGAEALLGRLASSALQSHGMEGAEVCLLLVGDREIQETNREQRGVDQPTDVLSFPMLEYEGMEDDDGAFCEDDVAGELNPETGEVMLGDIIVSLETAQRQAGEYGHSLARELGFLTVHGMLHLLGYDHEDEKDRALMRAREEEILAGEGLGRA